jgi:tetratricopeptide (TPR) repeat protein
LYTDVEICQEDKNRQTFILGLPRHLDLLETKALDVTVQNGTSVANVKVPKNLNKGDRFRVWWETEHDRYYCIVECPSDKRISYSTNRTLEFRLKDDLIKDLYDPFGERALLPSVNAFDIDVEFKGSMRYQLPLNLVEGDEFAVVSSDGRRFYCRCPSDIETKKLNNRTLSMEYNSDFFMEAFQVDLSEKNFKVNIPDGLKTGEKFLIFFKDCYHCIWKCPLKEEKEGEKKEDEQNRTIVISFLELEAEFASQLEEKLLQTNAPPPPSCTNCGENEDTANPLKACTCGTAWYCPAGKVCQKAHWKKHKKKHKKMNTPEAQAERKAAQETKSAKEEVEKIKVKEHAKERAKERAKEYMDMIVKKTKQMARVDKANACKIKGNDLFGLKFFDQAATEYRTAELHLWDYDASDTEEVKELRVAILSNRAQCMINIEDWVGCILLCNSALKIDGMHGQTFYRRGIAHSHLKAPGKWESAVDDFQNALKLDPDNKNAKRQIRRVKKMLTDTGTTRSTPLDGEFNLLI